MTELLDTNRLAYSGRALPAAEQAARVRRWGGLLYAEYRLRGMKAYLQTILLEAVGTPLLYLAAMGIGLGSLVDSNSGGIGGLRYLLFVAPALLVSTAVMQAAMEFSFPVMAGFKWFRSYYGASATPIQPGQIVQGELVAVGLRFVGQAVLFWIILLLFGVPTSAWSVLMIPIAVLAAFSFGAPMMAYAATLEEDGYQFSFVQRFIVMPMFLFAGTFYPLESMPGYLQWIGWISPMWHGNELARIAAYGMDVPLWLALVHVSFLLVTAVTGWSLATRIYNRRLTR